MRAPLALAPGSVLVLASLLVPAAAAADVKLPTVFGDHMVLQEGRKVPFWGTAEPGEKVTVRAAGATAEATAGADGRWKIELGPLERREPFTVTVAGRNTIELDDVVTGEVWIASGQSNMEWPLLAAQRPDLEVEAAEIPRLRLFQVERPARLLDRPTDVKAGWSRSTAQGAAVFSAVGQLFGRALLGELDRPIGIIHTSWGGTPAETWTSRKALAAHPQLRHLVKPIATSPELVEAIDRWNQAIAAWNRDAIHQDPGNRGEALGYASPAPQPGWPTMVLPAEMEAAGLRIDGAVWFRRRVALPAGWAGQSMTLRLGAIGDCDVTYVNGVKVGATCKEVARNDQWPRRYAVPAELTRGGAVLVAVRVFDERGRGGIYGEREALRLTLGDRTDGPSVSLAGEWAYTVEAELAPRPQGPRPVPPRGTPTQNDAGVLYDNMLAPLAPFAIRGAIWYQGESNARRAHQYRTLFPAMIQDWRRTFGQGDFPFYFVQLAAFHPAWPGPGQRSEDEWAELREAQTMALALPRTGMAVTIDIGDPNDIHPRNKQEVGRRLALVALEKAYGRERESSGPTYAGLQVEKAAIRVRFTHAEGLQAAGPPGGRLLGFTIAGRDRQFVAADARVEGDSVVVSAPGVDRPVAVRYGWSDSPLCNLRNGAGLPASPFRTDAWPGLTVGRK